MNKPPCVGFAPTHGGFVMFSKEIQMVAVTEYLFGVPQSVPRRQYQITGSATLYNWVESIKFLGLEGVKNPNQYRNFPNQ